MPGAFCMSDTSTAQGMMTQPKAVVFDVGRVLIQWDLRHLLAQLTDDPQELAFLHTNVVSEAWHHQVDEGRPLNDIVAERKAQFPAHSAAIEAYRTRFLETIPGPVPGSHELAQQLADAGVTIYGLTNFGADFWEEFLPTQPVFGLFSEIVVSGREGCAKPDPAIYRIAEARFGHAPHELLFVDDKAENIVAATERGWHGHVFTDAAALESDLRAFGLLR